MSFLISGQTKTVQIDDDNNVTIRKIGAGARQKMISKAGRMSAADQDVSIDYGALRLEQFRTGIVSWEGPGFDGLTSKPQNIEKLIDALDPAIFDIIVEAIDKFNAPLSDDEKKVSAVS